MKKLLVLGFTLLVALLFINTNVSAVESLLQVAVQNGTVGYKTTYTSQGSQDETKFEVQQASTMNGSGSFPSVLIYNANAGSSKIERSVEMLNGFVRTSDKIGQTTLVTSIDPNNDKRINGVLTQTAAGFENNIGGGPAVLQVAAGTAGGVVLFGQTQAVATSASIKAGGILIQTTGYGPIPGAEGPRGSAVTGYFEEHYRVGGFFPKTQGFLFNVKYSFSENSAVSVIPAPIVNP